MKYILLKIYSIVYRLPSAHVTIVGQRQTNFSLQIYFKNFFSFHLVFDFYFTLVELRGEGGS